LVWERVLVSVWERVLILKEDNDRTHVGIALGNCIAHDTKMHQSLCKSQRSNFGTNSPISCCLEIFPSFRLDFLPVSRNTCPCMSSANWESWQDICQHQGGLVWELDCELVWAWELDYQDVVAAWVWELDQQELSGRTD